MHILRTKAPTTLSVAAACAAFCIAATVGCSSADQAPTGDVCDACGPDGTTADSATADSVRMDSTTPDGTTDSARSDGTSIDGARSDTSIASDAAGDTPRNDGDDAFDAGGVDVPPWDGG